MSEKKFYRTVIQVEVLSEEPVDFGSLEDVGYAISVGDCSGEWHETVSNEEVSAERMAELLTAQGSDPGFFQLGDDDDERGDT